MRIRGCNCLLGPYTQNRSSLCFFKLMDCNALDYELAGCPVAGSATASGGIIGRTLESQLPGLPALGLKPNGVEARANTDIINSSLSGTRERTRVHVCRNACLLGKICTYWNYSERKSWETS